MFVRMPGSQDPRILSSCFSPSSSHCLPSIYFFFFRCSSQTSSIPYFLVLGGEMHYIIHDELKGLLITERVKRDLLMLWKGHDFTGERLMVTFALSGIPAARGSGCAGGCCARSARAVLGCLVPVWAVLGEQSQGRAPGWEHQAVLLPRGWRQGRCPEASGAIRLLLLLENQRVVQTIRLSFHFYHLCFLSGLCQSVGPGNLLMVKEKCVFTVLKVDLTGTSVM